MTTGPVIDVRRSEQSLDINLTGEWRSLQLEQIDAAFAGIDLTGAHRVLINTQGLAALDLSGAWRLREFINQARKSGVDVQFKGATPDQLRLVETTMKGEAPLPPCREQEEYGIAPLTEAGLVEIGVYSVREWRDLTAAMAFLGRVF